MRKKAEFLQLEKKVNNCIFILAILLITTSIGCDERRVYETSTVLSDRLWIHDSLRYFNFEISNAKKQYNLLVNIQYTNDFDYRNLYLTYVMYDSTGQKLSKSLVNFTLFSEKLGKPLGSSPIGDLYELQAPILSKYQFPNKGKYRLSLQQYMRVDSLYNLTRIGLRVEESVTDQ